MITRHFVDVGPRRVHYRRAGAGPAVLLVHQSPRSSAEYAALIAEWAADFTVIAPDTPGFGQSDPLPGLDRPEVEDYADALVDFLGAIGLDQVGGYGFHSGAIILVTTARRHPQRFTAIAGNGYAVWTPGEREIFGDRYTPPFVPQPYGEHLAWAWNRILEQSWFFPWYAVGPETRLSVAHDDPRLVQETVLDLLHAGDAYRLGYSAVLRAPRDVPPADFAGPPVLLTAAEPDPLRPHLDRLGPVPANWQVAPGPTRAATDRLCHAHLQRHKAPVPAAVPVEADDAGFIRIAAAGFDGLIHWSGDRSARRVLLHAPGRAATLAAPEAGTLAFDLPGHGLSDDFPPGLVPDLATWATVSATALRDLAPDADVVAGEGWSALLAIEVAARLGLGVAQAVDGLLPADPRTAAAAAWPDLMPDRFGSHLARAWQMVRAGQFFWPWWEAGPATAIPFDAAAVAPARLARLHLAALQARRARDLLDALATVDRDALCAKAMLAGMEIRWPLPDWASTRPDVWRPAASTI